jgi:hypothetical protein
MEATGMPISATFKKGLEVFQRELRQKRSHSPFDIFKELDLGPGGYTKTSSSETKKAVKAAIRRKLGR